MSEKLAKSQQNELFVFVEKLKTLKTKLEFKTLIKESEINISDPEKKILLKIIVEHFKEKRIRRALLIDAIVSNISQKISNMWCGMAYDYLDILQNSIFI